MTAFLSSPARRAAAVQELVVVAKRNGFAGWNFDQENQMGSPAKPTAAALTSGWRAFLRELGAGMRGEKTHGRDGTLATYSSSRIPN